MTDELQHILQAYQIPSANIEKVTKRVFKVTFQNHIFALKKSKLSKENLRIWESVYQIAQTNLISQVLPVYLTEEGKLYVEIGNSIYYLTPWIDDYTNRDKSWVKSFYHDIATIHHVTKRKRLLSNSEWKESFKTFQQYCAEMKNLYFIAIKEFERKRYMSPVELLVCTQFRDVEQVFITLQKRLQQFVDQDEKEMTWNYSLCHRNLHVSHRLEGYIINWESAEYNHAVTDLVDFFKREVIHYDSPADLFLENFSSYSDINNLSNAELQLLTIHLLDPIPYMTVVKNYMEANTKHSNIATVKKLQQLHRIFYFGLRWSDFVEKEYETVSFEDLDDEF